MLDGIRVIEHATYMAAPGAGGILSDWGADVIKIEPPGGDPIRSFFATIGTDIDVNPVFDFDNRGKKSIQLDTSTEAGQEVVKRLAGSADVFLTNVRPGGLARAGLDFPSLISLNPKLVYCSLTGYGLEGADRDRPGFDIASFWSRSGAAHITLPKGSEPFPIRTAFGDHITSISAAAGICAALLKAHRTGEGQLVEASLLRAALFSLGSDLAIQLYFGRIGSTKSRHEQIQPLANFFKTADGDWLVIVSRQGDGDWPKIARAFGLDNALIDDERFATAKGRRKHSGELVDLLDAGAAQFKTQELADRMDEEQLAWAPVQSLAQVAADPQAAAAGAFVKVPSDTHPDGEFKSPGGPLRFPGADDGPKGPSPKLGEHTDQVLKEIGYSDSDIASLKSEGALP